ncbi:Fur family transcriptional regulator [Roseinatronobacter sp. NSM]|uniref:Fur family transcriptional regulator n=1 Tax=Roseinatronobacter sp. NSM TaxID=3457785 RepID=UPI0040374112
MTNSSETRSFCCPDHSGHAPAQAILAQAESRVKAHGLRLTPVRRRTLEILLQAHGALGAYDVLEKLAADGFGAQPPVAYRALNFLVDHGLAHRIRRLNAFTACAHPGHDHRAAFLICETCDSVTEAPSDAVGAALGKAARDMGFDLSRATIEAVGQCRDCRQGTPTQQGDLS